MMSMTLVGEDVGRHPPVIAGQPCWVERTWSLEEVGPGLISSRRLMDSIHVEAAYCLDYPCKSFGEICAAIKSSPVDLKLGLPS
jgi:hypothetical protein